MATSEYGSFLVDLQGTVTPDFPGETYTSTNPRDLSHEVAADGWDFVSLTVLLDGNTVAIWRRSGPPTFEYGQIIVSTDNGQVVQDTTGGSATDPAVAVNDAGAAGWEAFAAFVLPGLGATGPATVTAFKRPT